MIFLDDVIVDQKPGPGDGTACFEHHTRIVKIFRFAQEPQGIAGRNPVGTIVFGIAVAGKNTVAPVSYTHLDVYKRQDAVKDLIVCIRKDNIGILAHNFDHKIGRAHV